MMRSRAFRRHQRDRHLRRRLTEDRLQHAADRYQPASRYAEQGGPLLPSAFRHPTGDTKQTCPCFWSPKAIARFAEQPKLCSCAECGNPRRYAKGVLRITVQEQRAQAGETVDARRPRPEDDEDRDDDNRDEDDEQDDDDRDEDDDEAEADAA